MHSEFGEHEERAELFEELANRVSRRCGAKGMSFDDALEVSRRALLKLMRNWAQIRAKHGVNSLSHWMDTTAYHEYLQLIKEEGRNRRVSLSEPAGKRDGQEEGEAKTLGETLEFEPAAQIPADEAELVRQVMALMPNRCRLKARADLLLCGEQCTLLWRLHLRADETIPVQELADEFGIAHGTMNDWVEACEERFEKLWKEKSQT